MANQNLMKASETATGNTPILRNLAEGMEQQLKWNDELMGKLYATVDKLKSIPPNKGDGSLAKDSDDPGYLSVFDRQINTFRNLNNAFEFVLGHLQTCI